MATSGSISFSVTGLDIVNQAFFKAGVKGAEQALTADELANGLFSLNAMVKAWQAQRLHLWTKTEGILFLDAKKQNYNLGPGGDFAANFDDFIHTTTTSNEIALATVIEVVSTAGLVALDNVGIKLDDNTRHWTTIVSVDSATQITIDTGIPSASASASTVFTFTDFIERPLRILSGRRSDTSDNNEIELFQFSRQEYFNQTNKASTGTVVNYYYSPQLDLGRLYVWPTASSVDDFVRFTYERTIQDFVENSNNPDFPVEWIETIIWNLSARISVDYNVPIQKQQLIAATANSTLDELLGFDEEPSSINIQPDYN